MTLRPPLLRLITVISILNCVAPFANAHDLPKQRVDRTVQLILEPGSLVVDYTLELDDTTIARDLKRLRNDAELPPDPDEWLDEYGRLVAPLIASALKLNSSADGADDIVFQVVDIERRREIHTIYAFRFRGSLNGPGRYRFRDTNFGTSDGVSRLGARAHGGVNLKSDHDYPESAASQPYRPVWMLDESELRKTVEWNGTVDWPGKVVALTELPPAPYTPTLTEPEGYLTFRLTRLGLISAALLGILHTLQPGHGKTLLAAASLAGGQRRTGELAIVTGWVIGHFAVIFLLAVISLVVSDTSLMSVSVSLKKTAGFLIACPAAFRLGERIRTLLGVSVRTTQESETGEPASRTERVIESSSGLFTGITAGLIPCWEAIGLLLLGISAGHPLQGLYLVGAFIAGSLVVVIAAMRAARAISPILTPNRTSGQILMIGLDMIVLMTGANLLLSIMQFQPFRS
jgi:ABC-type nickel/cobalt efflux system permease component RcnA